MTGLDTNVLVRYVVQDDAAQAEAAARLVDGLSIEQPGYVSVVTLVEFYWVLRRGYGFANDQVNDVVRSLLVTAEVQVAERDIVRVALRRAIEGFDFADALICELGRAAGCTSTVTLDRRAAALPGMRLLQA